MLERQTGLEPTFHTTEINPEQRPLNVGFDAFCNLGSQLQRRSANRRFYRSAHEPISSFG